MISRRGLHDKIVALLRDMIVDGELRPGERIPEQALCQRFGVSRTPLREALKVISAEGLVRLLPNRGATVVCLTRKEAEELIPLIGALEAFAAELATARVGEDEVAHIQSLYERMRENCSRGEAAACFDLKRAIHVAIVEAAGNETLIVLHHTLLTRLRLTLTAPGLPPGEDVLSGFEQMMEALRARDGSRLAQMLRQRVTADFSITMQ